MPLADVTELLVLQDDPRVLRFHSFSVNSLAAGQILIKIDKFGLTANNISYIATGKSLRYFDFFPADDKHYGKMNVWGFGTVTASNHAEVKTGERLWGYFPFASHLLCTPGTVSSTQIVLSRPDLPKDRLVYLTYTRLNNPAADPLPVPKELEDHAMLFRGLWATGFLLADHLVQKNYLGATSKRVLISSASSKTGYGLAFCIKALDPSSTTVGLTSKRNVDFVRSLGLYDDIVAYDEIKNELKVRDGVMVDMAGDGSVNKSVFDRLGSSNLKGHVRVGATHWDGPSPSANFFRPKNSTFFFAPAWAQQRTAELGPEFGALQRRIWEATLPHLNDWIRIVRVQGVEEAEDKVREMIAGDIDARDGFVVELGSFRAKI